MRIFKTNKILDRLNTMLDNAANGTLIESNFDESKVSAIESKFHKYLLSTSSHKKQLQENKEHVDELISDISHQTKTPLANIIIYAELLSELKTDEENISYQKLLKQQTEKLNFLITSLVKASRLENGIIAPIPKPTKIDLLLEAIKETFPSVEVKDCNIIANCDLKWTGEALINIIDNALKYGGTSISVHVTAYQMFCRIDIKDNGIGISEEELPRIFTRFYRSEKVADKDGVGLGLYLAREIITKQSGYIKVSSKENIGSTFSVFLPMDA